MGLAKFFKKFPQIFFRKKFKKEYSNPNLNSSFQPSDDWRGFRFLLISLIVTASSIIFFFAERHIFSKMEEGTSVVWSKKFVQAVTHQVIEWGGVKLKAIEVETLPLPQTGDPFAQNAARVKEKLSIYFNQPFWLLDLEKVKSEILQEGWVKSVAIRRSILGTPTLKVEIFSREPALLIHAVNSWAAVDAEGKFISRANQIPGSWVHLPIVFGFEEPFSRGQSAVELNRELSNEREVLKDLHLLIASLKEKVSVDVDSVSLTKDSWSNGYLYNVKFKEKNQREVEASFLSNRWASRLQSFQFILSDLHQRPDALDWAGVKIMGQYDSRWFVRRNDEKRGH